MIILALDTTQEFCSVALAIGDSIIYREQQAPRSHTGLILPQVESVMSEAGLELSRLDALAFGRGPGSFTGLRIAAGVAQGLALGANIPVIPVSSLAAMAQGSYRRDQQVSRVCAAFDARIHEVYWGNYLLCDGIMQGCSEEAVTAPEAVELPDHQQWLAIGSGWAAYPQMQQRLAGRLQDVQPDTAPLARDMIPLARKMLDENNSVCAADAAPVYLRQKVARTIAERQQKK